MSKKPDAIMSILSMIDDRATELNRKSVSIDFGDREKWFPFAYARDELRMLSGEIKLKYGIYPYPQKHDEKEAVTP